MYKILRKVVLNKSVVSMEFDAPFIAKKARAGQFIIFRIDEKGERVPLTISDYDREKGTITIIFQLVGKSTIQLAELNEGDSIADLVGPLGNPTEIDENVKRVAVIGGGVGCAIAFPQAKELHAAGTKQKRTQKKPVQNVKELLLRLTQSLRLKLLSNGFSHFY